MASSMHNKSQPTGSHIPFSSAESKDMVHYVSRQQVGWRCRLCRKLRLVNFFKSRDSTGHQICKTFVL